MKRCPECHRVETDESLKFCRVDGATLVTESDSGSTDRGTVKFGSAQSSEIETSILPHATEANINRATAPTTVLPSQPSPPQTQKLNQSARGKTLIVLGALMAIAVVAAGLVYFRGR